MVLTTWLSSETSKIVLATMASDSSYIESCTFSLRPAVSPFAVSSASSANAMPYPAIRCRWKIGWISRRCERCRSPPLVIRPLPRAVASGAATSSSPGPLRTTNLSNLPEEAM